MMNPLIDFDDIEEEFTATPNTLDLKSALCTAKDFIDMNIPERPSLLGNWLKQGDTGYLFAPRGVGKSWMAMLIGNAIATNKSLGEWEAGVTAAPTFYFDAEMNLPDIQKRFRMLGLSSENFHLLSNENLFLKGQPSVNIASVVHQNAISQMLPDNSFFIIDNLSTSQVGIPENDNDAFDTIKEWLLTLRHRGITTLIVHHAGRNGQMRGASRREDMAHWIISLKDSHDPDEEGVSFTSIFTKCRNCQPADALNLKWEIKNSDNEVQLDCQPAHGEANLISYICDGHSTATELSEILSVAPGTISKWAKKLMNEGKIVKRGRNYVPV